MSARPGTSEHQLGLALDIAKKNSSQLNTACAETEEGQWVAGNAHRFGFIVRYLKEYEDVTGYMYEPWHVRYVDVYKRQGSGRACPMGPSSPFFASDTQGLSGSWKKFFRPY